MSGKHRRSDVIKGSELSINGREIDAQASRFIAKNHGGNMIITPQSDINDE